jgi:hypothetical protein
MMSEARVMSRLLAVIAKIVKCYFNEHTVIELQLPEATF